MDQNVLFQMTPNSIWFFNGINFQNCFRWFWWGKLFLMRVFTIHNARSAVLNIWDAFWGNKTRRAFRHPSLSSVLARICSACGGNPKNFPRGPFFQIWIRRIRIQFSKLFCASFKSQELLEFAHDTCILRDNTSKFQSHCANSLIS